MYQWPPKRSATRLMCAAALFAGPLLMPACGPTTGGDLVTDGGSPWLPGVIEPPGAGATGGGSSTGGGNPTVGVSPNAQPVSPGDPTPTQSGDPILYVTTDALAFGQSSTTRSFGVRNDGTGTLVYSVQCSVPWVTITPESGTNTGATDQIQVTVNRSSLAPGLHTATVTVTSLDNQQRVIGLSIAVADSNAGAQPELAVSTDWITAGSMNKTVTFSVLNGTQVGVVAYTIESQVPWATVTPSSGTVGTEADTITVKINRDLLYTGHHETHLVVRDAAGPTLTVALLVDKPLTSPRIVPWLEVNVADEAEIQRALAGLRIWRYVTDTACISTGTGHAALFTRLRAEMPDMKFIPGFKTSVRLYHPGLDSIEAWQLVAGDIQQLATAAGINQVLLENETAIDDYLKGIDIVNLNQLRQGLQQLPPHIEIIWYPAISVLNVPEIQQRSTDLCRVVAETINPRFVDLSYADPGWPEWPPSWYARDTIAALSSKPTFPQVYFGVLNGWQYWYEWQVRTVLQQLSGKPDALFYPGGARWVESAQLIVNRLKENP